jgi:hypothetical protein
MTGAMRMTNALGSLDVDIILDEGPDTITMTQDTYDTMSALASKGQQIPPDVLLELSPIPSTLKRKLIARIEQAQQGDPEKDALEKQNAAATIGATKAKGIKDFAAAIKDFAEVGTMPQEHALEQSAHSANLMQQATEAANQGVPA